MSATAAQLRVLALIRDGEVYGHAVPGVAGFWWSFRGPPGTRRDVIERCVEAGWAQPLDHEKSRVLTRAGELEAPGDA